MDLTYAILEPLHAVHTLRIDAFHDVSGADMCATVLLHRPRPSQLRHLALHDLTLRPDDPQLVEAVQAQSQLVVRRLQLPGLVVAALGVIVLDIKRASCHYRRQQFVISSSLPFAGMRAGLWPACRCRLRRSHCNGADGGGRLQQAAAAACGDRRASAARACATSCAWNVSRATWRR